MARKTEITVQVYEDFKELDQKLKNANFVVSDHYVLKDNYFSRFNIKELKQMSYEEILKNSLIVRNVGAENKIMFKDKILDKNNNVISEEKINLKVEDYNKAVKILSLAGMNNWCSLVQDIYEYKNENISIGVQIIDDLGVFIEYEEDESLLNLETKDKIEEMIKRVKMLGLNIGADYSVKKVYEKFKKDHCI